MLIEVNNDNLFINAKNISFARFENNCLEFTEFGSDQFVELEVSDEGRKVFCDFFKSDEDFIEVSFCQEHDKMQYVNVRAITKIHFDDDDDDEVTLSIYFINDSSPWAILTKKENALEVINEINKKVAKPKYVDHF